MKHEIAQHLGRTWRRYRAENGDRLAAAVSFYGFVSFFPLVLLALSAVGFVVRGSANAEQRINSTLRNVLPDSLLGPGGIDLESIAAHRSQIGLVALVGLVISGIGWIGSLREAMRRMWGAGDFKRNWFLSKAIDIGLLSALGLVLALSVALTGLATQATHTLIDWMSVADTGGARTAIKVIGLTVPFAVDLAVFGFLLSVLPHVRTAPRSLIKGAFLGALLFEALKYVGALYVAHTAKGAAIYGTFAVIVGLVIWLNLVSRITLLTAAWTATALPLPGPGAVRSGDSTDEPQTPIDAPVEA